MTTSNTISPTTDLHAEGTTTDDFGINVGSQIEQQLGTTSEPAHSEQFAIEPASSASSRSLPCNVGRTEQKIRIGAGAALIAAAAFAPVSRGWRIGLGVFGAAEILTGALRYCPVSQLVGVNTCSDGEQ